MRLLRRPARGSAAAGRSRRRRGEDPVDHGEDLPFVRRLTAALQARNREIWVDLEDIIPSARWMEEIHTGITGAHAVAFVITPDWVASEVCHTELDYATEASKRLVPILARETPDGSVPSALAELNWLSFLDGTDFEAGVRALAAQAEARRGSDPRLALQLGVAAHRIRPSVETGTSLYTTLTGTPLTTTLTGHTSYVLGVAFSPDGHALATASRDNLMPWRRRPSAAVAWYGRSSSLPTRWGLSAKGPFDELRRAGDHVEGESFSQGAAGARLELPV